jgi:hypothetical protein
MLPNKEYAVYKSTRRLGDDGAWGRRTVLDELLTTKEVEIGASRLADVHW